MNYDELMKELYSIDCQIENLKFLGLDDEEEIIELEEQKKKIEKKLEKLKHED